jgi:hypothetical protein
MKCVVCKCLCVTYICEACREGASEISDKNGRPIAVILENGNMYKLKFAEIFKPNEMCVACKGFIEKDQHVLCRRCSKLAESEYE